MEFIVFPEHLIKKVAVEEWPFCDCLISFHSTDFPLDKAIEYVRLRRPYVINDLHRQYDLVILIFFKFLLKFLSGAFKIKILRELYIFNVYIIIEFIVELSNITK